MNDNDDFLWAAALNNSVHCLVNDTNWLVPTEFESDHFESISFTVNAEHIVDRFQGLLFYYSFVSLFQLIYIVTFKGRMMTFVSQSQLFEIMGC